MVSNSVGIGGSQIYDFTSASALSLSIVAISSLGALAQALLVHNPLRPGTPLADLQATLLLAPALLCGVTVGVLANHATTMSGLRLWRKETAIRQQMLACTPIQLDASDGDLEAATLGQDGAGSDSKLADGQLSQSGSREAGQLAPMQNSSQPRRSLTVMRSFRAAAERQQSFAAQREPDQPPAASDQRQELRRRHSGMQLLRGTSLALRQTLQLVATGQCEAAHLAVDDLVCLQAHGSVQGDLQLRASRSMVVCAPVVDELPQSQLQRFCTAPPVRSSSWRRPLGTAATTVDLPGKQGEASMEKASSWGGSTVEGALHMPPAKAPAALQQQPRRRFPQLPWRTLAALAGVYATYLGLVLGGNAAGACSVAWYVLVPLQFVGFLVLSGLLVWKANQGEEGGASSGTGSSSSTLGSSTGKAVTPVPGPAGQLGSSGLALAQFSLGMLIGLVAITVVGGAIAALFGSGGGIMVVPLLLQLGVAMQPAAATSSVLVFIGASAGALTQLVLGNLNIAYAGVFGGTALVASLIGTYLSRSLVRRLGRPSVLVFAFVALLVAALVVTIAFPAREAVQELVDVCPPLRKPVLRREAAAVPAPAPPPPPSEPQPQPQPPSEAQPQPQGGSARHQARRAVPLSHYWKFKLQAVPMFLVLAAIGCWLGDFIAAGCCLSNAIVILLLPVPGPG
ncbi:Sulfite exporter family [Chlorella sorokiniana]|uniref:Sulfite exporter family n=1 Tax=Chlorella sorokiniana TaxID=3076 RepID=A0A2P6TY12_CHLSO|nr:Sulfite exporter family [Chlorella sorokiniana]|eukprot:PRW58957.1 Sulfite exporter family [Chlorella sorokiniana]